MVSFQGFFEPSQRFATFPSSIMSRIIHSLTGIMEPKGSLHQDIRTPCMSRIVTIIISSLVSMPRKRMFLYKFHTLVTNHNIRNLFQILVRFLVKFVLNTLPTGDIFLNIRIIIDSSLSIKALQTNT